MNKVHDVIDSQQVEESKDGGGGRSRRTHTGREGFLPR